MDCENLSGLATACSYWRSAAPNSSPSPTVCSHLGVPRKPSTSRMDGSLPANAKSAISATTIYPSDHFNLIGPSYQGTFASPEWTWLRLQTPAGSWAGGSRGASAY